MVERPYDFLELTNSVCSTCLRKVEAKILAEGERVLLQKRCPVHGIERVLISTDRAYYDLSRRLIKPGQMPRRFNTPIRYGCPYDCGLCPDHEQHSCVTVLEITDQCNLHCPICYAESSPRRVTHRSLRQIEFMLDCIVRNEGEPDVVQISGGEPSLHPEFFSVMKLARSKPIKHLMLNTNGIRIANEPGFAPELMQFAPRFEIYLQFDSLRPAVLAEMRGEDLTDVRCRALERLNELNISTTLVVTLKKGVNDDEIGEIVSFALKQKCVRGITFQPVQMAGRTESFDQRHRLTLSEVRHSILDQTSLFKPSDIVPVPCHPDCLAMGYALKLNGTVRPLSAFVDPAVLYSAGNTILNERHPGFTALFSTGHSPDSAAVSLKQLLCCLPSLAVPTELSYENVFRVLIVQFMDAHNLDVRSIKRSCIHIVHPDGRIIPFDSFNLFYRDRNEQRLRELQAAIAEPLP